VLEDAADGPARLLAQAVRGAGRLERVAAALLVARQVQVEAAAAAVVERFGHERGEPAFPSREFLDARLEAERAIGRVHRGRMDEVDFELTARVLVVAAGRLQTRRTEGAKSSQQMTVGVAAASGRIDVARLVAIGPPPVRAIFVRLAQEIFELRPDHRGKSSGLEYFQGPAQHLPGRLVDRSFVGRAHRVADAPRHARFPRNGQERVEVGHHDHVGQPGVEHAAVLGGLATGRGVVDGAAEGQPALRNRW
jgi:hypothetical protein